MARMCVLQNLCKQIQCNKRCRDDVNYKVQRVAKKILPQGDIFHFHQMSGHQIRYRSQRRCHQTAYKKDAGRGHIADAGFTVEKEYEQDGNQSQCKIVTYKIHKKPPVFRWQSNRP